MPVRLAVAGRFVDLTAKLDTGASFCIFNREAAEDLGLDIESGQPVRVATAIGSFSTFGHAVTLSALGLSFDTTVYFAAVPNFPRNVLGQRGWLNQVRLALVDHDGQLYLSQYS